jgi:CMP/dCMP kinase
VSHPGDAGLHPAGNAGGAPRRARIVAIDGPAAAGKGTLARRLAAHLGYAYLDTGSLYRAVGVKTLDGADADDAQAAVRAAETLDAADLRRPDLRTDKAAVAASKVAAIPAVRDALLSFQRNFADSPPDGATGAVLDGRDIGTVVCPHADVKLFVTASLEVRAARRLKELRESGLQAIDSRILRDMQERDARDAGRVVAPLELASDAIVIDTSRLDPDAVFAVALRAIASALLYA